MIRTFTVEWPDICGPMWINKDNLLGCLVAHSPTIPFKVRDVTGKMAEFPTTEQRKEAFGADDTSDSTRPELVVAFDTATMDGS